MVARNTAIAGAEPAATLAAEGLGRRYRRWGPWALRDVTLGIPAGSVTALVGPNGAGKKTLLRCWMGFERPDAGRVRIRLAFGDGVRRDRIRLSRPTSPAASRD
ncbi:MAG: hypothetical protein KatS3mg065_0944 [Chloroflexota bacterium]|nr:MAG: hypothetical protein KatS3mg065_0944 [Chloroflexota bacterium]